MKQIFILLITGSFFYNCAPKVIVSASNAPDTVQICQNYNPSVGPGYREKMDFAINEYIYEHNSKNQFVKLDGCNSSKSSGTLYIDFDVPNYVGEKQNGLATVGNVAGLVLPMAMVASGVPYFIYFYFWPDTKTPVLFEVTDDLVGPNGSKLEFILQTPGYFNSISKQDLKQSKMMKGILQAHFRVVEKEKKKLSTGY